MVPPGVNLNFSLPQDCLNCTHPPTPELDVTKAVILVLVMAAFLVFGVMGNALVILSVACHQHLRTATHYLVANLAAADLLLSLAVIPFSAIFELLGRWVFGRVLCNAWAALDVLCCTASIMSLCAISVDRCIAVTYPLRYPTMVTHRRGLLAVVAVWGLSVVISVAPLFGWKEPDPEDESICLITQEPGYTIFSAVGSFYIPLAVILAMYCRVYAVARRELRGLRVGCKTDPSDPDGVTLRIHRGHSAPVAGLEEGGHGEESQPNRAHFTLRLRKLSHEKKAAKTLSIVVGCFMLCWLPFFLVLPIGAIFPSIRPSDAVFKTTFWLGYFNSCINPMIYPCFSKEFKRAFQNLLRPRCLKRRPPLSRPAHPVPSPLSPSRPRPSYRRWGVFLGPRPSRAPGCGKGLLRACCWAQEEPRPTPCLLPGDVHALPVLKEQHTPVCQAGDVHALPVLNEQHTSVCQPGDVHALPVLKEHHMPVCQAGDVHALLVLKEHHTPVCQAGDVHALPVLKEHHTPVCQAGDVHALLVLKEHHTPVCQAGDVHALPVLNEQHTSVCQAGDVHALPVLKEHHPPVCQAGDVHALPVLNEQHTSVCQPGDVHALPILKEHHTPVCQDGDVYALPVLKEHHTSVCQAGGVHALPVLKEHHTSVCQAGDVHALPVLKEHHTSVCQAGGVHALPVLKEHHRSVCQAGDAV